MKRSAQSLNSLLVPCFVGVLAMLWGGSAYAGNNKLVSASQKHDGYARVLRVGNKDVIEVLEMPTVTARMQCKADGYRVNKVGPKNFNPVSNDVSHSWTALDSQGPTAKQLGSVCRAGRAAARLPVSVTGECEKIKFAANGVQAGIDKKTMQVPFAVDCRGYQETTREALILWKHPARKDNLVMPASKKWYTESLGYVRTFVLGDTPKTASNTRKKMHMGIKGKMRGSAVAPVTMISMHKRGWTIGPKHVAFVEQKDGAGRTELHSFYHSGRRDYALAAGPQGV